MSAEVIGMGVTEELESLISEERVRIFGVADTEGFEHALPEWHSRRLVPRAARAVVLGRPFAGVRLVVDEKTGLSNDSYGKANEPVLEDVARLRHRIADLLDRFGCAACFSGGFNPEGFEPTFSYRLAQHEAGVEVYGQFGVCIRPDAGCWYTIGVLLTDVEIPVTARNALENFRPCSGCRRCAGACPAGAIDANREPEVGYDRDRCIRYIQALKKRHGADAKVCARCFSACPWGYDKVSAGAG
jgi:epoxyqueuosine reductase QueG